MTVLPLITNPWRGLSPRCKSNFNNKISSSHHNSTRFRNHNPKFSLYEGIQTTLSEIVLKLNRMDKQLHTPRLLLIPSIPHHLTHFSSTLLPPPLSPIDSPKQQLLETSSSTPIDTHNPRLPKLEIPMFSDDNPLGWLFQINCFFLYHNTPSDQRLTAASFYMTGSALQWFHWLHNTNQRSTWEVFARDLEIHFSLSSFQNHEPPLYKLHLTTTVSDYLAEFEVISIRTTTLLDNNLINCFL